MNKKMIKTPIRDFNKKKHKKTNFLSPSYHCIYDKNKYFYHFLFKNKYFYRMTHRYTKKQHKHYTKYTYCKIEHFLVFLSLFWCYLFNDPEHR